MPAKPAAIVDPYVTLGLEPGAPMAEVKRAHRRLAKAFHPDSAGEQAMPRFLAIQAAYDQIRTGRVVLGGMRGSRASSATGAAAGPGGAATGAAPGEPWRADPARARAARERARTGGAASKATGGAGAGTASGAGGTTGRGAGGRGSTGTSGTGGGAGTGGRRRATRKATMGSTSYDEARDPADATWSGASWYGPSTGEYWIVNPREYADPRKHGPDYQQRARRPAQDPVSEAAIDEAPATGPIADATTTAGPTPAFDPPAAPGRDRRARTAPRWEANAAEAGWVRAGDARPADRARDDLAGAPLRWLGAPADDPVRRFGLALVAWPPIGLAAAALIGDATGCATFGAACDGAEPMLPWLAQAVILGLLLLLPPLTRILATGTIAVLVALLPITAFLVSVGASGAPEAAPVLTVFLGMAWIVGIGLGLAMRVRRPGMRAGT